MCVIFAFSTENRSAHFSVRGMEGKLKVLCLHGFTQNAETFRAKTGSVRKNLKSKVEFVFVDAPHSAAGFFDEADRSALGTTDGADEDQVGPRAWWLMGENDAEDPPEATKVADEKTTEGVRAALASSNLGDGNGKRLPVRPAQSTQMRGWEATELLLRETTVALGPFDGVLGFSQGASTAALALATIPELRDTVKFAVLFSGFEPMDPNAAAKLRDSDRRGGAVRGVRSLHVHGVADRMVTRQRAEALMGAFEELPELFSHEGGHGVPSTKPFRERLKQFVLQG